MKVDLNVPVVGKIVDALERGVDNWRTTDEERMEIQLRYRQQDNDLMLGQMEVNKEQAKHPSVWVAGGRPAVIWVCAAALAWHYILYPMLAFFAFLFGLMDSPPSMNITELMTLLGGMLGFGGLRSLDKLNGKDTKDIDMSGIPDIKILPRALKRKVSAIRKRGRNETEIISEGVILSPDEY